MRLLVAFLLGSLHIATLKADEVRNRIHFFRNHNGVLVGAAFSGTCENFLTEFKTSWVQQRLETIEDVVIEGGPVCAEQTTALCRLPHLDSLAIGVSPDAVMLNPGTIACLGGLPMVKELKIFGHNQSPGEVAALSRCRTLQILDLGGGLKINSADLDAVGSLAKLTTLRLSCQSVDSGTWLGGLTNVSDLSISANRINKKTLLSLPGLNRLTSLSIHGVDFASEDLRSLALAVGNQIEHLHIQVENHREIEQMVDFPRVEGLSLSTSISGETDLKFLRRLPKLKIVYLTGWKRSADAINIEQLEQLESLSIGTIPYRPDFRWTRRSSK